jgi:hypothetical protein
MPQKVDYKHLESFESWDWRNMEIIFYDCMRNIEIETWRGGI